MRLFVAVVLTVALAGTALAYDLAKLLETGDCAFCNLSEADLGWANHNHSRI